MKTKAYCVESKEKELSKDLGKMKGEYNNNEKTKEKDCLGEIGKGVSDYGKYKTSSLILLHSIPNW